MTLFNKRLKLLLGVALPDHVQSGWISVWKALENTHLLQRNIVYEYNKFRIIASQIANDDKEIQQLKTDKARLMHEVGLVLVISRSVVSP